MEEPTEMDEYNVIPLENEMEAVALPPPTLHPHPPSPPPRPPSPPFAHEWVAQYMTLMGRAIAHTHQLATLEDAAEWALVPDETGMGDRISLFERKPNGPSHGFFTLKARGVVHGRSERYAYVIRDHDPETRLAWDRYDGITKVQQLESYLTDQGTLELVQTRIAAPSWIASVLVYDRYALGVQNTTFNRALGLHKYVFRSVPQHPHYSCPADAVPVDATVGVYVRALDGGGVGGGGPAHGPPSCELTLIVHVNVGGWLPPLYVERYRERVRERVYVWERAVERWNEYYGRGRDPKNIKNRK
jgi:hypothetical protein